jgi:ribonuclease J
MSELRFLPLGGMGKVTQNMYVYEYEDELLIVDCGFGFPDHYMPGVDVLIPDITYLQDKMSHGKRIVGMILTHGHDDHIGALPYLLPELPEFPIYASPLTAGFAKNRMKDGNIEREITVVNNNQVFEISPAFSAQSFTMTHSVPDTRHYAIHTPEGIIYHGSDFKLDPSPVDGVLPDFQGISAVAGKGVLCMLIDSLRVERSEWTKSESLTGPAIEKNLLDTEGMFIVTLMSSHIHRIQQTVDAAEKHHRKVVFVGRSVEQNVEIALELNKLRIPKGMIVDKREINDHKPSSLCVIIAGSQGQEGSSLIRAISGEHPIIQIKPQDKVIFSADVIPGNELNYYGAIDELCRNGITVIYPDVEPDIHHSGHASAPEQQELLGMVKPKFVMPIGGADRHRVKFFELVASPLGYEHNRVLLPALGEVIGFSGGQVKVVDVVELQSRTVDGLGIGDVGPVVLSDRRALSQAGMIVLVLPRIRGQLDLRRIEVVSRGFVFMKEATEVIEFIKKTVAETVTELGKKAKDDELKRTVERRLSRKLYKTIQREPVIVPVIIDL